MSIPHFTCPKCGGHYFGADPATGRVQCHGSGSVSLPEFAAGKRQRLCAWSGPMPTLVPARNNGESGKQESRN